MSIVKLRVREILLQEKISVGQLLENSDVTQTDIDSWEDAPVEMTEELIEKLNSVARATNTSVLRFIGFSTQKPAYRFRLFERMEQQKISLEQLSNKSGIHPLVISFYEMNPVARDRLCDEFELNHLNKLSCTLECSVDDLRIEEILPKTRICVNSLALERGITLEELASLIGLPYDYLRLIEKHPLDLSTLLEESLDSEIFKLEAIPESKMLGQDIDMELPSPPPSSMFLNSQRRPFPPRILCCMFDRQCCTRR